MTQVTPRLLGECTPCNCPPVAAIPVRESRPRAVLFDLDGTLVDTMPAFADLAARVMADHFGDDPAEARTRYLLTSGVPFLQQLRVIHPGDARSQAAAREFEARKEAVCRKVRMDADTREDLERLRIAGLRLVVSSNTGQNLVDEFVEREAVPFDLALGFDGVRGKGEGHVAVVCARFGLQRRDLLAVGDSLKDGELAAAAGVAFVGRLGTFDEADFARSLPGVPVIRRIADLAALFR